jgi:hypothetical protein
MSADNQSQAPQAPAAQPAAAPAADPQLDSRLVAIARRERELQQKMESFKKDQQGYLKKDDIVNYWKSDRNKLRELLGASPEELPDPANPQDEHYSSLKKEIEALRQERESENREKATSQIKNDIKTLVTSDKDAYELINAFDSTDMVFDLMVDHYREHQEELDPKTAAEQVEKFLYDQVQKVTGTKKISSLFQQKESPKEPSPTLTGSSVSSPHGSVPRKLSYEESLAEAAKLIKWK